MKKRRIKTKKRKERKRARRKQKKKKECHNLTEIFPSLIFQIIKLDFFPIQLYLRIRRCSRCIKSLKFAQFALVGRPFRSFKRSDVDTVFIQSVSRRWWALGDRLVTLARLVVARLPATIAPICSSTTLGVKTIVDTTGTKQQSPSSPWRRKPS